MFSHIVTLRVFLFVEIRIVFPQIVTFVKDYFSSNRDFAVPVHGDNTCALSNRDFMPCGDLDHSPREFFKRYFAVFSWDSNRDLGVGTPLEVRAFGTHVRLFHL